MPFEHWSGVTRLLVMAADTPTAVHPAIATLLQALPQTTLTLVGCASDWASSALPLSPVKLWLHLETQEEQHQAISWLRAGQFEVAILLTAPGQSPYTLAYLCYLAGIPVRLGQSLEFGGSVLSHPYLPPDQLELVNPHLHLLESAGLPTVNRGAWLPDLMTAHP